MAKFKQYSILSDTLNGILNSAALHEEIKSNLTLNSIFDGINRIQGSDQFTCNFITDLDTNSETTLDFIVSQHSGTAPIEQPSQVNRVQTVASSPFAAKVLPDGRKLYKIVHGMKETIGIGQEVAISFVIPYNYAEVTAVEIVNGMAGDTCDFEVYDTPTGTISGYPNVMLNQFGFNVNISPVFHREESSYDADVIKDMKLEVHYKNNSGINLDMGSLCVHCEGKGEMKDEKYDI